MRRALAGGAWVSAAAGALLAFALVASRGSSDSRLFWIGFLAVLLGAVLLVALAAKVIPGLYGDYGRLARLRWPLAYWNELALVAAATVPLGLWLAGRRERPLRARVAGVLHVYVAFVAVVLTFSRFGIFLAIAAAVVWVWLDRERLDSFVALLIAAPVAAIVAGDALLLPGIADDYRSHHTRVHDGLIFGLLFVAGAFVVIELARRLLAREPDVPLRRSFAVAGVWVGLAVCVLGVIVLVVRAGGPADFVRVRWDEFAHAQSVASPGRIASTSSGNRWSWWGQAWDAFTRHPGGGTGAGSFALTSTVAAHNAQQSTVEPHNVPLQFLSETGIVGFLLYAGLIAAVIVAIVRGPRDRATQALGFLVEAASFARDAHNLDPLALEPIQLLAVTLESARDLRGAERYYGLETKREPQNPETWYDLGAFYSRQKEWRRGYDALNRSYTLNAFGPAAKTGGYLDQARCHVIPTSPQCPVTAQGAS